MKNKRNKVCVIIISILILLFLFSILDKKVIFQDDIIFFKLFGNGKIQELLQNKEKDNSQIYLKVSYENINFKQFNLINSINSKNKIYRKIAPGTKGEFSIILHSNEDLSYQLKFQSKNSKPQNLVFLLKGDGKKYKSLEEMEDILEGRIRKLENKIITIQWEWEYENGKVQDKIDTEDGSKIEKYNFIIYTIGGVNEN